MWLLDQIKERYVEHLEGRIKRNRDEKENLLRAVADAGNVRRMCLSDGWKAFLHRYTQALFHDLSVLGGKLRDGDCDTSSFQMQVASVLAKARAFEDIEQMLLDGEEAQVRINLMKQEAAESGKSIEELAAST